MRVKRGAWVSHDIHTHTPAKTSSTNFILYKFVLNNCHPNCYGHGHGYESHSSLNMDLFGASHPFNGPGSFICSVCTCRPVEQVMRVLDRFVVAAMIRHTWLRTNGVNTNGPAAKVMNVDRLGTKVPPGTFGKTKVG